MNRTGDTGCCVPSAMPADRKGRLLGIVAVMCLLVGAATAAMLVRSYWKEDRLRMGNGAGRVTVHSHRGKLWLSALSAYGPVVRAEADRVPLAARLRNDDLRWLETRYTDKGRTEVMDVKAVPIRGSAAAALDDPKNGPPAEIRPLFRALDDPQRFVAAHVLLTHMVPCGWKVRAERRQDETYVEFNGLQLELDSGAVLTSTDRQSQWLTIEHSGPGAVRFDPVSTDRITDQWHDRLDKRLLTLHYWLLIALSLVTPVLWLHSHLRHVTRLKRGLCANCGYDLRAGTERCPECGRPIAPVSAVETLKRAGVSFDALTD